MPTIGDFSTYVRERRDNRGNEGFYGLYMGGDQIGRYFCGVILLCFHVDLRKRPIKKELGLIGITEQYWYKKFNTSSSIFFLHCK